MQSITYNCDLLQPMIKIRLHACWSNTFSTPSLNNNSCTSNISVYVTRLQVLQIIYCYRSLLSDLLHHLQSYSIPSLHYLRMLCFDDSKFRALTTFLPQCANLRTLYYERGWDSVVSESVEDEMWEAAVRRCRNLEEVRVDGDYSAVSCDRLGSVLRKLSEMDGIQALKLRRIVRVDWGREEDCTDEIKHLLPALYVQHA